MQPNIPPFHLAIRVKDLASARAFYGDLFQCDEGRSSDHWVDFNFFGHQLVCHLSDAYPAAVNEGHTRNVDSKQVPIPHFGIVLTMDVWQALADRLAAAKVEFLIEPYIRFKGQIGEQATMFLLDPSGNALEFKAFADIESQLFAN